MFLVPLRNKYNLIIPKMYPELNFISYIFAEYINYKFEARNLKILI